MVVGEKQCFAKASHLLRRVDAQYSHAADSLDNSGDGIDSAFALDYTHQIDDYEHRDDRQEYERSHVEHHCYSEWNAHKNEVKAVREVVPSGKEEDCQAYYGKHWHQRADFSAESDKAGMKSDDGRAEIDRRVVCFQFA